MSLSIGLNMAFGGESDLCFTTYTDLFDRADSSDLGPSWSNTIFDLVSGNAQRYGESKSILLTERPMCGVSHYVEHYHHKEAASYIGAHIKCSYESVGGNSSGYTGEFYPAYSSHPNAEFIIKKFTEKSIAAGAFLFALDATARTFSGIPDGAFTMRTEAEVVGATVVIRIYADGVLKLSYTDTTPTVDHLTGSYIGFHLGIDPAHTVVPAKMTYITAGAL